MVVVGDVMVDVVAAHDAPLAPGSDTAARISLRGGGAAANVAAWLAHAGVPVTLVGRVGDDALADVALAGLGGVELRVARDPERPTGTCVVLVGPDGERTMLPDPGANDAFAPAALPRGDALHLSAYSLLRAGSRPGALAALEQARAGGMRISLDAASAAPLAAEPRLAEWVGEVDLLLANADEAPHTRAIAARERVVKRGAAGAEWSDGTRAVTVAAVPARAVDTTGAGDAFAAGFLSAWPGPPEAALATGCRLAAEAVTRPGARPP
ncbi:MAG TPA: PfkB family carbohydrate kinase [Solirubrobacteraceae bacterium]